MKKFRKFLISEDTDSNSFGIKIDVREDNMGNLYAKDNNNNEIFIQEGMNNLESFITLLDFDARDEGYNSENSISKEEALKEVSKGWTITFRIGRSTWEGAIEAYSN